ncbi:MAG: PIN domain-containing protein [Thermosphaera sp.]
MKLTPDTNVPIYDTIGNSEHRSEAAKLINSAKELLIPSAMVHEHMQIMLKVIKAPISFLTLGVCEYLKKLERSTSSSREDPSFCIKNGEGEDVKEANDCIILAIAPHFKSMLATFDYKLRRRAMSKGLETPLM